MPALLIGRNNGPASIPAASSHARSAFTAGLGATEIAKRLGLEGRDVSALKILWSLVHRDKPQRLTQTCSPRSDPLPALPLAVALHETLTVHR